MKKTNKPQVVQPGEEIPPGTKQVTQVTTERFTAPLSSSPPPLQDSNEEDNLDAGADDATDDGFEFVAEEEAPVLSSFERMIVSLNNEDDVTIYVRRKPDPPNSEFRNPYSGSTKTIGEIPYDPSLDTATAIDLAVQKAFGGGYYLLEFKRGGKYAGAASRLVGDAIETRPLVAPAPSLAASTPPAPPSPSPIEQIRGSLEIAREFRDLLLPPSVRNALNAVATGAGGNAQSSEPADPIALLESNFDRVEKWRERLGIPNPLTAPLGGGGERSWVTDLSTLLTTTGIGEGVRQAAAPVGQVIGHLIAQWIVSRQQQPNLSSTGEASPNGGGMEPGDAKGSRTPPQQPAHQNVVTFPAPSVPLLSAIVAELTRASKVETSVQMTLTFIQTAERMPGAKEEVLAFLNTEIIDKSTIEVAQWLVAGNPAWAYILGLQHCAAWIESYRDLLREALAPEEDAVNSDESHEDVSNLLDAALSREPPAVDCPNQSCGAKAGDWCGDHSAVHIERAALLSEAEAVATGSDSARATSS